MDEDPLFVDEDNGDLRLSPGSPCIDAADGNVAPVTDIWDNDRYDDPETSNTGVGDPQYAEIGAIEYYSD